MNTPIDIARSEATRQSPALQAITPFRKIASLVTRARNDRAFPASRNDSTFRAPQDDRGFAFLESAFILLTLMVLIFGGVIIAERFQQFGYASRLLDKLVHDDLVHPLSISNESLEVEVRHAALQEYVVDLLDKGELEISSRLESQSLGDSLFLEGAYAVISINQLTGAPEGLTSEPVCLVRSRGQGVADPGCGALATLFRDFSEKRLADFGDRSLFALPHVRSVRGDAHARYLPYAVVVGARLGWKVRGSFAESYGSLLGLSDEISEIKAVVLRGEIEL